MIVYLLLNTVNSKCYVGQHGGNCITGRWPEDLSSCHNAHLARARDKYGYKAFSREILNYCASKEEMNNLESLWIITLRTYDSAYGYNKTFGGEGGFPTEEIRDIIRRKAYARHQKRVCFRVCYGCYATFDANAKVNKEGTFCSKKCAENDRMYTTRGVKKSPEHVLAMSKARIGKAHPIRNRSNKPAWNKGMKLPSLSVKKREFWAKLSLDERRILLSPAIEATARRRAQS